MRIVFTADITLQAWTCDISVHDPKLTGQTTTENAVIHLLTIPKRHHFAILEDDVHRLDDTADNRMLFNPDPRKF